VFALTGYTTDGSKRLDLTTTLAEPRTLEIKHSSSGKGGDAVDRHLVSASSLVLNTAGVPRRATVNLTISVPRDSSITAAAVRDLVSVIVDLISDGGFSGSGLAGTTNLDAILRGES
jgi:hypothetical protein